MNNMPDGLLRALQRVKHAPLRNYIIPGLTSWMMRDYPPEGCLRFFEMDRDQHMEVAPHSHRFDFDCYVVKGTVRNTLWLQSNLSNVGDEMVITDLIYEGTPGKYRHEIRKEHALFRTVTNEYQAGSWYTMSKDEIHSIWFSKGAEVLFFEGPQKSDRSIVLEPFSAGHHVKQAATLPWMFLQEETVDDHFA